MCIRDSLHIAFNVAGTIGNGQQAACGTAALDLQGDGILSAFEHNAHHGGSRQQAAQRGRGAVSYTHLDVYKRQGLYYFIKRKFGE